jgi:hypothetical protein
MKLRVNHKQQTECVIAGLSGFSPGPFYTNFTDVDGMQIAIETATIIRLYEGLKHDWKDQFEERINQLMNRKEDNKGLVP